MSHPPASMGLSPPRRGCPCATAFIHTADVHLDAPFAGLTASSDRIGRALVEATYEAFRRVIDTAIAREVDFVVIAGDAYNSRDKSLRAQLRFRAWPPLASKPSSCRAITTRRTAGPPGSRCRTR